MSLKEIARICEVSPSTISRILSGKNPKCASEAVKARVWAVAKEMNYLPNQNARLLKTAAEEAAAPTVGIAFSRMRDAYSNHFFQTLIQSISEEALRRGCPAPKTLYVEDYLQSPPKPDKKAGLVVLGRCSEQRLRELVRSFPSLICVGLNPYAPVCDQVICNGRTAAEMAMQHLLDKGHLRIGYVGECENEVRYLGYRSMLIDRGIPFDQALVYNTSQSLEGGRRAAKRILDTADSPSALFCANDATAIGVLSELQALAPEMPRPAVISIDNIDQAQEKHLQLTTIHIPIQEMGAMAVKLLLDRIGKGHASPIRVEFPCNLVRRQSS